MTTDKQANAEARVAVANAAGDVQEMSINLIDLVGVASDRIPPLQWAKTLIEAESIRKRMRSLLEHLATSPTSSVDDDEQERREREAANRGRRKL